MAAVNESEWLQELARLSAKQDKGLSTAEWAEKLGLSPALTVRRLKQADSLGWLVRGKQSRLGLDLRNYTATVYSIAKPKKGR